jgi:hypothetical protein
MATRQYTPLTLKLLYSRSGNCCAYPECRFDLTYEEGNLSDICHIEALNPGGPRYNSDPSIDDKDRNAEPNLMLLCKHHHNIIDQKNSNNEPYYTSEQLKAMKQEHVDFFATAKESLFRTKSPSLLAKIIKQLSEGEISLLTKPRPLSFKVDHKIDYNEVIRNYGIIEKLSLYSMIVDKLYNELEAGPKHKVLDSINNCYLANRKPNQSADDIFDTVRFSLIQRLEPEGVVEYSEDLEWCVNIIMVDAFMRCKILEEPKAK